MYLTNQTTSKNRRWLKQLTAFFPKSFGFAGNLLLIALLACGQAFATTPTTSAVPANRVTYAGANLNGLVNPGNETTTISFEYGLTTSYGSTQSVSGTSSGTSVVFKTAAITGLTAGKTYHYRVKAVNASGTSYGNDRMFVTGSNFNAGGTYSYHTVTVGADGIVYASGNNTYGQLGNNTTTNSSTPVKVLKGAYSGTTYLGDNTSNPIISVSLGQYLSIALAADGSVYTFGYNGYGQLGDGTSTSRSTPVRVLKGAYSGTTYLGDNSSNPIISIVGGLYNGKALAADGSVYTFGYNGYGQLGDNTTTDRSTPVQVLKGAYSGTTYLGDNSSNPIISLSGGTYHNLAVAADGSIYSFGYNGFGQLGDNSTTDRHTPVQVLKGAYSGTTYLGDNSSNPIVVVSSGGYQSIVLAADGQVYTFGWNGSGQIGDNTTTNRSTPVKVLKGAYSGTTYLGDNSSNPIVSISGGGSHSIALASNGSVFTFGNNNYGQLGDNSTTDNGVPVHVAKGTYNGTTYLGDNSANPIIAITGGQNHTIAMAADGSVFTLGYNAYGQLGDNTTTDRSTPIKMMGVGAIGNLYLICVTAPAAPTDASSTADKNICTGTSTTLSATGSSKLSWYSASTGGTFLGVGNSFTTPTLTADANYYVQDSTCTVSTTRTKIKVTVYGTPAANVGSPATICLGSSVSIGAATVSGSKYTWTSNPVGFTSTIANPTVTPTVTTTYYLTEKVTAAGCTNSDSVTITINNSPTAGTAYPSASNVCVGTTVDLHLGTHVGATQWQAKTASTWSNIGSSNGGTLSNQTVNVNTQYRAIVTGTCGTDTSNTITVTVSTCGTSVVSGNWSNASTWGGAVPSDITNIFVNTGRVSINSTANCHNLTINANDTLAISNGGSLTINGKFTINGTLLMTGGTIILNSCDTIPAAAYWQLKLTAPCTYVLGGNVICSNNFLIPNAGTTLQMNGHNLTATADVTHNGSIIGLGRLILNRPSGTITLAGTGTYGNTEVNCAGGVRQGGNNIITDSLILTQGNWGIYAGVTLTVGTTSTSTGNIITVGGEIVGSNSSNNSTLRIYGNSSAPQVTNLKLSSIGSLEIDRPNGVKLGAASLIRAGLVINNCMLDQNGYSLNCGTLTSSLVSIAGNGKITNRGNAGYLNICGNASAPAITSLKLDTVYNAVFSIPAGVTLGNGFYTKGLLTISNGDVTLNGNIVTLGASASISEAAGNTFKGNTGYITTTRNLVSALSSNNIAGLGGSFTTASAPGITTIKRGHATFTSGTGSSIKRYFAFQPTNYSGNATSLELVYDSSELNGATRTNLRFNQSDNSGSSWSTLTGGTVTTANTATGYAYHTGLTIASGGSMFTLSDGVNSPLSPVVNSTAINTVKEVSAAQGLEAFPNPFENEINLNFSSSTNASARISITDLSGKTVTSENIEVYNGINRYTYSNAGLSQGMYIMSLTMGGETRTIRIVKK